MYFDNYCGSIKIISLGFKRFLKTQIFLKKKGNLSSEKKMLTNFSGTAEYDKPQGTKYKGPQGMLTTTVQVMRSTL